ncbi:hypothetical protein GobsT_24050 [Gemmata obscuriglobus]|nr:hypothetical protein GobsT_24050 [Gemmata obscuriglobus]VTS04815.1 unnamed protein product [Gemmata obscuriglobus UQM 2246]
MTRPKKRHQLTDRPFCLLHQHAIARNVPFVGLCGRRSVNGPAYMEAMRGVAASSVMRERA